MNLDTTYAGVYFLGVASGMVILCIGWAWDARPRKAREESATDRLERLDRDAPKSRPTSSSRKAGRTGVRG